MAIDFGNSIIIYQQWTDLKTIALANVFAIQYQSLSDRYVIFVIDDIVVRTCNIYTGSIPSFIDTDSGDPSDQTTNDSYKSDFETNYKPYANLPIAKGNFDDPRLIRRFGNTTTTSTSEVLVSVRAYTEQSSDAQRSVQSSSTQDKTGGTGSTAVRITYLNSNYVLKTEDVTLNGTTKVNTVNTDIRFIEKFEVIAGALPVGAISLMNGTTGGATEFCGIAAATQEAFLCHHYVPAGKRAWITGWGATGDDEIKLKLYGAQTINSNSVTTVVGLENLMNNNSTSLNTVEFTRDLKGVLVPQKSYIRVTVVPNQTTSTTTRAWIYLFEDVT
jgi:hypothetical protein